MENIKLNNGILMPGIGFGTWKIKDYNQVIDVVKNAIEVGYRHIDTASVYGNEEAIGIALKESCVPRKDIFVTTKLWNSVRGYNETICAFNESLKKLQLEYIDLYLIHWPSPLEFRDCYQEKNIETYQALEKLYSQGKIKAIGVSNFLKHHIEELKNFVSIPIAVNQIEFHPYYYDQETIEYCKQNDIIIEAYSPLGRGEILKDNTIADIAKKYNKSPAQICIRYAIDNQIVPLPKTISKQRMIENLNVFDFNLMKEDIDKIRNLSKDDKKIGSNPDMQLTANSVHP